MQFLFDGACHRVSRITGPKHNLLGIEFDEKACVDPPSVATFHEESTPRLNLDAVVREVAEGVRAANEELGTHFRVAAIQYVADDTPPESTYRLLAFALAERLAKELPFERVPPLHQKG